MLIPGGTSYYATVREAQALTQSKQAVWLGPKRIERKQDDNIKGTWIPRQSGPYGPLVLQFQT